MLLLVFKKLLTHMDKKILLIKLPREKFYDNLSTIQSLSYKLT